MKTNINSKELRCRLTRRGFLATSGLVALTTPAALADTLRLPGLRKGSQVTPAGTGTSTAITYPDGWWLVRNALVMKAEGVVPLDFVLPPLDAAGIPVSLLNQEARLRITYPVTPTRNLLSFHVFLAPIGSLMPWPVVPPPTPVSPTDAITISYGEVRIDDAQLGSTHISGVEPVLPSLGILGRVVSNSVPSPFGNVTSAPCHVSCAFQVTDLATGWTEFSGLVATFAGSHLFSSPLAEGWITVKR